MLCRKLSCGRCCDNSYMSLLSESNTCSGHLRIFQLKLFQIDATKLPSVFGGEVEYFMSMPSEMADGPLADRQASYVWVSRWFAESKGCACEKTVLLS